MRRFTNPADQVRLRRGDPGRQQSPPATLGIVEAPMNQGNRQIVRSTDVLLPSTF